MPPKHSSSIKHECRPAGEQRITIQLQRIGLLPALALIFLAASANASDIRVSQSSLSRHIYQPSIKTIKLDTSGFLWVATQQGLYQFIGDSPTYFDRYEVNGSSYPISDVTGIQETANGTLVVATNGSGLLEWNWHSMSFQKVSGLEGLDTDFVTHITVTTQNRVVAATRAGLIVSLSGISGDLFEHKSPLKIHTGSMPTALASGNSGKIFFATRESLYHADENFDQIIELDFVYQTLLKGEWVTTINTNDNNAIYLGTNQGRVFILSLQLSSLEKLKSYSEIDSSSVTSLVVRENEIWVGTSAGLSIASEATKHTDTFNIENSGISDNHVTYLYSHENSVLVGTFRGLNIAYPLDIAAFNYKNSGIHNDIMGFVEHDELGLLIATFDGLFQFNSETNNHTPIHSFLKEDKLPDRRVMSMAIKENQIWLGFYHAELHVLDIDTWSLNKPDQEMDNVRGVTRILHNESGVSWVGTYDHGLFRYKGGTAESLMQASVLTEPTITGLHELANGDIVIAANNKLFTYQNRTDTFSEHHVTVDSEPLNAIILSIAEDAFGKIWLGTKRQGLIELEGGITGPDIPARKMNQSLNHTLLSPPITIYGIQFGSNGSIWCSTELGIVEFDSDGQIRRRYGRSSGSQDDDYNFGASFKNADGELLFGGSNGYNRFHPPNTLNVAPTTKLQLVEIDSKQPLHNYYAGKDRLEMTVPL